MTGVQTCALPISQYEQETNYLRVHLAAIRKKLEPLPAQPRYFVTEPGIGYRFTPDTEG